MVCPECGGKVHVIDNVSSDDENYRKRECKECGHIFYTLEFEVEYDTTFKKAWRKNHRVSPASQKWRNKKWTEKNSKKE